MKMKDSIASMSKESLVKAYRALEARLQWFEKLEQFWSRNIEPLATAEIDLGEYDKHSEPGESLSGEVYAPFSACGGVIRIVWRSADNRDSYVIIKGFEDWISDCLRKADSEAITSLGERILAERLNIQVNERRPKAAA